MEGMYMDFSTDDRLNKANKAEEEKINSNMDMDMDMEYDMIPMPMYMQGMAPAMTPPCMQGMMGMPQGNQGLYPMMGMMPYEMHNMMMPQGMMGMMSPNMQGMMPEMMSPNMQGMMPQMYEENLHGMNMMEMEDEDYRDEKDEFNNSDNKKTRDYDADDINKILMKIERYNSGIFALLRRCGMSYPMAKRYIRRIIRLTLMYYED
jgi:RNA polymerase-binding transcription factor DksA